MKVIIWISTDILYKIQIQRSTHSPLKQGRFQTVISDLPFFVFKNFYNMLLSFKCHINLFFFPFMKRTISSLFFF